MPFKGIGAQSLRPYDKPLILLTVNFCPLGIKTLGAETLAVHRVYDLMMNNSP